MAYANFSDVPGYATSMLWRADMGVYASTGSPPATALETGAVAAWDDQVLAKRLTPSTNGGASADIFRAAGRLANGPDCPAVSSPWAALLEGFGSPIVGCVLSGTISALDARNCTIYIASRRPVRSAGTGVIQLWFTGGGGSDWGFGSNYVSGNRNAVTGPDFAATVQRDMGMCCLCYVGNSATSYTIQQGNETSTKTGTSVPSTTKTTVTWQGISNANTDPADKVMLWIFPGTRHSAQERADVMALIETTFGLDLAERTAEFLFMGDSITAGQAATLGGSLVNQVMQPPKTCLFQEAWPGAQLREDAGASIQGMQENWASRGVLRVRSGIKTYVVIAIGRNDLAIGSTFYSGSPATTAAFLAELEDFVGQVAADGGYPILMPIMDSQIAGDASGTTTLRSKIATVNAAIVADGASWGAHRVWDIRSALPELYASGASTTRRGHFNSDGVHLTWTGINAWARELSTRMFKLRGQPDPYAAAGGRVKYVPIVQR